MENGPIYVLLIGDNLLAKKTFVNSFAYYLKFSRFEDAMRHPDLIKRHHEPASVKCGESLRIKYRPSSKKVICEYKIDGITEDIRLIDLPTFGNVTTDEANIKRSMDFLASYKLIHAIYIFPRTWQFPSVQFKYMLNLLTVHFEKSIFNKITLIINKSSESLKPDIAATVTRVVQEFTEQRIHVLDDEAFNYLLAYYKGCIGEEVLVKTAEAWTVSAIYARALHMDLVKTNQTAPYEISKSIFLNTIRNAIPQLIKQMACLCNAIQYNKTVLTFKRREEVMLQNLEDKTCLKCDLETKSSLTCERQILENLETKRSLKYNENNSLICDKHNLEYLEKNSLKCDKQNLEYMETNSSWKCEERNLEIKSCLKCEEHNLENLETKRGLKNNKHNLETNSLKCEYLEKNSVKCDKLSCLEKRQLKYEEHYEEYIKLFSDIGKYIKANSLAYYNSVFIEYLDYRRTRANQRIKDMERIKQRFQEDKRVIEIILAHSSACNDSTPTMNGLSRSLSSINRNII